MNTSDDWQLHVLGAFRLTGGSRESRVLRRKIASLLVYLVLHPEKHGRQDLATLLWGESPDSEALHSLRSALTLLRDATGDDILITDNESVQFNPTFPLWVDALAFQSYATRFLAEAPFDLSAAFIDLYKGDLLPDFYDDWIAPERERLRTLYLDVLLHMTQQMRSHSAYGRAVEFARRVLAVEPANERAHQHLMFCYIALGDRSAALKQYGLCRQALEEELGVEPLPETTALYHWIKANRSSAPARESRLTNLPIPLSSFVGREQELATIKQLVRRARLVTLTGPGGSGKTRLAIQAATDLLDAYKDGVWFVDLSGVQNPTLVAQAIVTTVSVTGAGSQPANEVVVDVLCRRALLLVLDNCEHLAAACAHVAQAILACAPQVKILATSRETLNVEGEQVYPVPGLAAPAPAPLPLSLATLSSFAATRLFLERAMATSPETAPREQDAAAVAGICRQLDGMPLAIELAAARLSVLSARQIGDLLRDRFALLASGSRSLPPRQASLRAAIDWSYDLLSAEEQGLLRRLSVFVGGCSLPGATAVHEAGDATKVLDLLSRLVGKSLLVVDRAGDVPRYHLLETIRVYAWDRLIQAGEKDDVVRRSVTYLRHLLEDAFERSLRQQPQVVRQEILGDYDNLIAALEWCREMGDVEQGFRLIAPASEFVIGECDLRWLDGWLHDMLSAPAVVPPARRGQGLLVAGMVARRLGDLERAYRTGQDAVVVCLAGGDDSTLAFARLQLGRTALFLGKHDEAASLHEQSIAFFRQRGYSVTRFTLYLAQVLAGRGDRDQARVLLEGGLQDARKIKDMFSEWFALRVLADMAYKEGDYATSAHLFKQSLATCIDGGFRGDARFILPSLAVCAALLAKADQAVILFSAFMAQGSFGAAHVYPGTLVRNSAQSFYDTYLAPIRADLGEAAFDALMARGRAMSLQEAFEYALA